MYTAGGSGNDLEYRRYYDPFRRISAISNRATGDDVLLAGWGYSRDEVGNPVSARDAGVRDVAPRMTYFYDSLHRLTYAFDLNYGNATSEFFDFTFTHTDDVLGNRSGYDRFLGNSDNRIFTWSLGLRGRNPWRAGSRSRPGGSEELRLA